MGYSDPYGEFYSLFSYPESDDENKNINININHDKPLKEDGGIALLSVFRFGLIRAVIIAL